jgi:predicted butyrate kinase (DUF1464 family)
MIRVLGIDPGTRSFDICGLEDGKVYYEAIIDTPEVAVNPDALINGVEAGMPVDLIAGPSGYGVELTYLEEIPMDKLEDWYLTYILLLKREDLERAMARDELGIKVYYAMTKTAIEMKRRGWPVCYIPGVVHLPTVPKYRKINKIDMGTADKMCIAVLGVYDQANRLGLDYNDISFILVEMGFGYNAVIGVDRGRIVDGIGGTYGGPGFLTIGAIDAEIVQLVGTWEKSDIFTGGGMVISNRNSPEEMIGSASTDEASYNAWRAILESVVKNVYAMKVSVKEPREILISGRLTRIPGVEEELIRLLSDIAEVRRIGSIEGAKKVKEAAQGYAIVADGLAGGRFKALIEWMGIKDSKGTVLDNIYHPKIKLVEDLFKSFT